MDSRRWILLGLQVGHVALALAFGVWNQALAQRAALFWAGHLLFSLVYPALVAAIAAWLFGARSLGLGLRIGDRRRPLLLAALAVALLAVSLAEYHLVMGLLQRLLPDNALYFDTALYRVMPRSHAARWLYLVYALFCSGVMEELTRAATRPLFDETASGHVGFVLFSATLFASLHVFGGLHQMLTAWVLGLIYSALFVRVRSLWPLIFAHTAMNAILIVLARG